MTELLVSLPGTHGVALKAVEEHRRAHGRGVHGDRLVWTRWESLDEERPHRKGPDPAPAQQHFDDGDYQTVEVGKRGSRVWLALWNPR